jgi:hypothetical protein
MSNTLWIDAALVLNNHLIEQINGLQKGQCIYDTTGFIAGVGATNHIDDYTYSTKLDHQPRFNYASDLIAGNDAQIRFDFKLITTHKKTAPIPDSCNTNCKEQIFIEENKDITLIPRVGNQKILFGSIENKDEKFEKLFLFYTKAMPKVGWDTYSIINLKFKNQIVATRSGMSIVLPKPIQDTVVATDRLDTTITVL